MRADSGPSKKSIRKPRRKSLGASLLDDIGASAKSVTKTRKPAVAQGNPDRAARQPSAKRVEALKASPKYKKAQADAAATAVRLNRLEQIAKARAGKPFRVGPINAAVQAGYPEAKNLKVKDGQVIVHHRLRFRPDEEVGLDSKKGGIDPKVYRSGAQAPVLKVLDQTTRPLHAIAGATDAAITGKSIPKAALRGLQNKDKVTFAKVLKDAGAPKVVQTVGGFVGDVVADPTTYLTLGTGTALKAGAHGAVKDAEKGVTVKLAGKQVPGVTRATAVAGRGAKKVGGKSPAALKKVAATVKDLGREVRPSMAPAGSDKATHAAARAATRKGRAIANQAAAGADRQARGLKARLEKLEKQHGIKQAHVAHALDTGDLASLPKAAHTEVKDIAKRFDQLKQLRKAAGVKEGEIDNYFPRAREDALHAKHGIVSSDTEHIVGTGTRRTGPTLGSAQRRKDRRPLHEVNPERVAEGKSPFSTDIPLVYANYARDTGRVVGEHQAFRELAKLGRPYHEGDLLKPNEGVYHLGHQGDKFGLRPFKDGDPVHPGEYVVLDNKSIDTVLKRSAPAQAGSKAGKGVDKTTAAFKRVATFTPGFHVRNAIGDTQMAYLSQPGHTLPRNVAQAAKANRANVRLEKAQSKSLSGLVPDSGKTIKVAGKRMSVEEFARLAREHGVTNSGQIGRELKDLAVKGESPNKVKGKVGRAVRKPTAKVEPTMRGRENVIRMATFKHGLDKGLSPREAADLSLETHIDYGDLTELERKTLRRAMPFYTFTARSTPLHLKKLVTNPGKFANYEKVRENVALAMGADLDTGLTEQQQRQAPLVVKIGGKTVTLSGGLPLASAGNLVPTSANPLEYVNEVGQTVAGLANPIIKDPVELFANKSFFFRSDIENEQNPIVSAPIWVKYLPESAKKALWVREAVDKRTGKKVLKWRGKADYLLKASMPGPGNIINQVLAQGSNQRGQGLGGKLLGGATGLKIDPVDPVSARINTAYESLNAMNKHLQAIKPSKGDQPSKDYLRLKAAATALAQEINSLSIKRGDKTPMKPVGFTKPKGSSSSGGWGGAPAPSGGSDWGGSSSASSSEGWG